MLGQRHGRFDVTLNTMDVILTIFTRDPQPRSQGLSSLPPLSFLNDNGGREETPWERG